MPNKYCEADRQAPEIQSLKLIRWAGPQCSGTLAMTPSGKRALCQLLEKAGIREGPEGGGLLCVREPWLEALLLQLTMQRLMRGVCVTDQTLKARLKTLISDAVSTTTPVGTETENRKRRSRSDNLN